MEPFSGFGRGKSKEVTKQLSIDLRLGESAIFAEGISELNLELSSKRGVLEPLSQAIPERRPVASQVNIF